METPVVEVLHVRHADEQCVVEVFINGQHVQTLTDYVDVDPGRGHLRSEWNQRITENDENTTRTPEFQAAVGGALEANSDSKYIEDDVKYRIEESVDPAWFMVVDHSKPGDVAFDGSLAQCREWVRNNTKED